VLKGDRWVIKTKLESGMTADVKTTYELKEINEDFCLITGVSKIETANRDVYFITNGMPSKYDLTGTMISDFKIYRKSGWIIKSKISQNIGGTIQIKDNPQLPGGMRIPMTMNNETIINEN
jgi:hypothetical protein